MLMDERSVLHFLSKRYSKRWKMALRKNRNTTRYCTIITPPLFLASVKLHMSILLSSRLL